MLALIYQHQPDPSGGGSSGLGFESALRLAEAWGSYCFSRFLQVFKKCLTTISHPNQGFSENLPQTRDFLVEAWLKHGWSMGFSAWPSHFSRISAAASREGRCSRLGDLPQRGGAAVVVPAKGAGHGGAGGAEVPRQQGDLPFLVGGDWNHGFLWLSIREVILFRGVGQ